MNGYFVESNLMIDHRDRHDGWIIGAISEGRIVGDRRI